MQRCAHRMRRYKAAAVKKAHEKHLLLVSTPKNGAPQWSLPLTAEEKSGLQSRENPRLHKESQFTISLEETE